MPAARVALVFAAAVLATAATSCHHPESAMPEPARLDRELRRVIAEHPDSVVGLLIRTTEPLSEPQRERLAAAGVTVHSVVGTIATARARAAAAGRLADYPFVVHVQLAATIPMSGH
jgi:hypothetical protein